MEGEEGAKFCVLANFMGIQQITPHQSVSLVVFIVNFTDNHLVN